MKKEGFIYTVEILSQLLGIPVRLYENGLLFKTYANVTLIKDPFELHKDLLNNTSSHISYYYLDKAFYYVLLNSREYQIVIGPFSYFKVDTKTIDDLAFLLEIDKKDKVAFHSSILSISTIPLESVIQSVCSLNYVLNDEMLSIKDIVINDKIQEEYQSANNEIDYMEDLITSKRNSTKNIEDTLCSFVRKGDNEAFDKWIASAPSIRAGSMSNDYLRQTKNTFIVSATLFSRSAMEGGMEYNDALDMADKYIRQCEECRTYNEINNLSYSMLKDFISTVNKIKANNSPLESKISSYIYNHISEVILLDDLADQLYMSKANLCYKFKKETGNTVAYFIMEKKIEEGKRLLKETSKSISSIAYYLGFSSQAHFTKAFKDIVGDSPLKYRNSLNK